MARGAGDAGGNVSLYLFGSGGLLALQLRRDACRWARLASFEVGRTFFHERPDCFHQVI